ncbi:MAG: CDP-glycerol glycerophosphotransferase family protein [Coriobacteriia bacterium]|nr:CDP-glycerol glycerophosphotransferase family protein [Coriobacteriia bacterium]
MTSSARGKGETSEQEASRATGSNHATHPPAEAHFEFVVDTIRWHRTRLTVGGFVRNLADGSGVPVSDAALDSCRVSLIEVATGQRATVHSIDVEGLRFTIVIDVFFALEGGPLTTGTWLLVVATWQDGPAAARMDPTLSVPARGYEGVRSVRGGRYWLFPVAEPPGDRFALAVSYRKNSPDVGSTSIPERLRKRAVIMVRSARQRLFRSAYRVCTRIVQRNGTRILFTSNSRGAISGNLLDVRDRMRARGMEGEYTFWYLFKPTTTARRPLLDTLRMPYYLAAADVILLDDYHPAIYKLEFPPRVRIIQLWHASGAFKTVGYSRIGKPGGPNPFSAVHKNYTYAIVSSAHDVPFYAEAFGIDESRVVPTGIPRMDVFFDPAHRARTIETVRARFPETRGTEVILFAPTFRGNGPSDAYYDYDRLDLGSLYALACERDAVVLFKMHPFVRTPLVIPDEYRCRLIDASDLREINDLLFIADLVITDYSSLVFEYCTLGRPMLFYAYDLEDYVASRDFYEEFEEFVPGRIVRTFEDLLEAVRTQDFEVEKVATFAQRHLAYRDGASTDRVIDQLILGRAAQ